MALHMSDPLRAAGTAGFEAVFGPAPWVRIYEGSVPNFESVAIGAQLALAEFQLPLDFMGALAGASVSKIGTWQGVANSNADGVRQATFFRMYANNAGVPGTCHLQGTVSAAGGGGDIILDDVTPAADQGINIGTFTLSAGND